MKFKVYEVEERTTATGIELKKLVLQGEGKQYPDKNVTMWADHPLFMEIAPGQTIEAELHIEDSKTPNPKGGFYKNKTLLKPGQLPTAPKPAPSSSSSPEIKNFLEFKIVPMLQSIAAQNDQILRYLTDDQAINNAFDDSIKKSDPTDQIPF